MFILVIIALAGFSLYFLLKPPTDYKNGQTLRSESSSEPESAVTKKNSMPASSGSRRAF